MFDRLLAEEPQNAKALAYRGNAGAGRLSAYSGASMTVTLFDQNNQSVATRSVTTNAFGTAAGEFPIPTGRALGAWRVTTSLGIRTCQGCKRRAEALNARVVFRTLRRKREE